MRYAALLYGPLADGPAPGTPEFDAVLAAYDAFDQLAGDAVVGGEAIEGNESCRTVRHDGGTVHITDGPYAEVAEGLGGLYLLEAESLDDAVELARRIPAAADAGSGIELRPIVAWAENRPDIAAPPAEGTARYLATIHGPERDDADSPVTEGWGALAAEHAAFGEAAADALQASLALHPRSTATTIRVREGELEISDGPFAEVLAVTGGAYVLAGTAAEVGELAVRIPVPAGGAVELRPIVEYDG